MLELKRSSTGLVPPPASVFIDATWNRMDPVTVHLLMVAGRMVTVVAPRLPPSQVVASARNANWMRHVTPHSPHISVDTGGIDLISKRPIL